MLIISLVALLVGAVAAVYAVKTYVITKADVEVAIPANRITIEESIRQRKRQLEDERAAAKEARKPAYVVAASRDANSWFFPETVEISDLPPPPRGGPCTEHTDWHTDNGAIPAIQDRVSLTFEAKPGELVTIREIEPILVGRGTLYDPFEGHLLLCEMGGVDEVSFLEVDVSSNPATATLSTSKMTCTSTEACTISIEGGRREAIDVSATRGLPSEGSDRLSAATAVLARLYRWDVEFLVFSDDKARRLSIAHQLGKPHFGFVALPDDVLSVIDRVCWDGQRWLDAKDGDAC